MGGCAAGWGGPANMDASSSACAQSASPLRMGTAHRRQVFQRVTNTETEPELYPGVLCSFPLALFPKTYLRGL